MRIPLTSRPYQERSLIAGAQSCINLYGEINTDDSAAPVPITYYPTPGSNTIVTPNTPGLVRCTYRTSLGTAYVVIGPSVYFLANNLALVFVGSIPDAQTQVIMSDNGLAVVLVDGTAGWVIDINSNQFAPISDPSFLGASYVLYLDTFFVFNRPKTNQFYISLSLVNFGLLSQTSIGTGTITNGGSLYTNAVYQNVPLTGGSGTDATADITISGGAVTAVDIDNPGKNYLIGDILSADPANIGGTGSGFQYTVNTAAPAFDPLDIAAKSGSADPIVALLTVHQELWLIGELTTEIWIGTGAADFFFQQVQGAYIEHGCAAQYSASNLDVLTFWVMQDRQGHCIVVKGQGYDVKEISTPALVVEFSDYTTIADAIGFCFQIADHPYYCLIFPTANKTWLYDLKSELWSQWAYLNTDDGTLNRHRANCGMFVYNQNIIGDYINGKLYQLNQDLYQDDTTPIICERNFPHLINNNNRIMYLSFDADMEAATQSPDITVPPIVNLSWSDDRGKTFQFPVQQSLGLGGEYLTTISWNRLGMARDRIFKLSWSANTKTALNGAFIESNQAKT